MRSIQLLAGIGVASLMISGCGTEAAAPQKENVGKLETVVQLPIRPGNVTATLDGRVFATIHPFGGTKDLQLIEVTGNAYKAWPNEGFQTRNGNYSTETLDSPLGIAKDQSGDIWVSDMGFNTGKSQIWGFDVDSGELLKKITLPEAIAPKGSVLQDLAVDSKNGWVYLADIANPGIIAVDLKTEAARRFGNHPSLRAEPQAKMVIDGELVYFQGQPASVAVNPLTLSADNETLYFGAMNGTTWYSVPTKLFRSGKNDQVIANNIKKVGSKPVSDGAATDAYGNHFFTNLNENGIDMLDRSGRLIPVVRDERLDWPDNVQTGDGNWLYIAVNQLHKTPTFTGSEDKGTPPYAIYRIRVPRNK